MRPLSRCQFSGLRCQEPSFFSTRRGEISPSSAMSRQRPAGAHPRPRQSFRHLCSGGICAGRLVEARPESRQGPKGAEQGRSAPAAQGMDALCGRPGMRDDQAGTPEPKQSKTEHRIHGERMDRDRPIAGLGVACRRCSTVLRNRALPSMGRCLILEKK